jgi:hypothetical protein
VLERRSGKDECTVNTAVCATVFLVQRHVASAFAGYTCRQVESRQAKPWEQCYGDINTSSHLMTKNCGNYISSEQWYADGTRNNRFIPLY